MILAKMVRRSVVPTLTLLAVPLLLAAPASAQTLRGSDPGHDVQKFDTMTFSHAKAAGHANADLKRYAVRYRGATIQVVETFRALDHSEPVLAVGGSIRMPSGIFSSRVKPGSFEYSASLFSFIEITSCRVWASSLMFSARNCTPPGLKRAIISRVSGESSVPSMPMNRWRAGHKPSKSATSGLGDSAGTGGGTV